MRPIPGIWASLAVVAGACSTGAAVTTPGGPGGSSSNGGGGAGGSGLAGTGSPGGGAGVAGGPADAGSAGGSGGLAPGGCGTYRRIALPTVPPDGDAVNVVDELTFSPQQFIWRVAGGFAVGPWYEMGDAGQGRLDWVRVDPDAQTPTMYSTGWGAFTYAMAPFNMLPSNSVTMVADTGYDGYWTYLAGDASTAPAKVSKLIDDSYSNRTTVIHANVSLDGQRGLFSDATISSHPVWLGMFAPDGTPVGDVVKTTISGVNANNCESVLPTEHGLTYSLFEGGSLHLIELDASATVVLDLQIPLVRSAAAQTACPTLVLADTGFATLASETTDAYGDGWILRHISRDGSTTIERWQDQLRGCGATAALAVRGDTEIAVCDGTVFQRAGGQNQQFPLERSRGTQIPSEPGTLFMDMHDHVVDGSAPPREIFEIRCPD
ncbi:MAG TPA: hypothetical protein VMT03_11565 [Polyangia bacterium]|nr:hypothetical protein [Polyangia bacterium]